MVDPLYALQFTTELSLHDAERLSYPTSITQAAVN